MERTIIVREVGAYGLWEAVTTDGEWLAGGFNAEQARCRAELVLDPVRFARSLGTHMGKQPNRPPPVGRR